MRLRLDLQVHSSIPPWVPFSNFNIQFFGNYWTYLNTVFGRFYSIRQGISIINVTGLAFVMTTKNVQQTFLTFNVDIINNSQKL